MLSVEINMGGISLLVATKDKPEHSLFDSYLKLHPEMYVKGYLGLDLHKITFKPDVELGKKGATNDEPPIQIVGPVRIFEDDDTFPEIAELVPAPCWQMEVWCNIRSEQNWERTEDVTRYVAKKYQDVLYSAEGGVELPEPNVKVKQSLRKRRVFDILALEWFTLSSKEAVQSAQVFLDALKDFPEARPVRFDENQPLQEQLSPDDDQPFLDAWRNYGVELQFKSRSPCLGGSIRFPEDLDVRGPRHSPIRSKKGIIQIELKFEEGALSQDQLEKVFMLFVVLAGRLECSYARGYVDRGFSFGGGGLTFEPGEIKMPSAVVRYGWLGIPPYTVWLSWFGRPYRELVMDSVKQFAPLVAEEGVVVKLGDKPLDMHELEANFKFDLPKELLERWAKRDFKKEVAARKEEDARIPDAFRGMKADLVPKLDD